MPIDDILAETNATQDKQAGVDRRFPSSDQQRRQRPEGRRGQSMSRQEAQRQARTTRIQDRRERALDSPKDAPTTREREAVSASERQFTGEPQSTSSLRDGVEVKADREDVDYISTLARLVTSVI